MSFFPRRAATALLPLTLLAAGCVLPPWDARDDDGAGDDDTGDDDTVPPTPYSGPLDIDITAPGWFTATCATTLDATLDHATGALTAEGTCAVVGVPGYPTLDTDIELDCTSAQGVVSGDVTLDLPDPFSMAFVMDVEGTHDEQDHIEATIDGILLGGYMVADGTLVLDPS